VQPIRQEPVLSESVADLIVHEPNFYICAGGDPNEDYVVPSQPVKKLYVGLHMIPQLFEDIAEKQYQKRESFEYSCIRDPTNTEKCLHKECIGQRIRDNRISILCDYPTSPYREYAGNTQEEEYLLQIPGWEGRQIISSDNLTYDGNRLFYQLSHMPHLGLEYRYYEWGKPTQLAHKDKPLALELNDFHFIEVCHPNQQPGMDANWKEYCNLSNLNAKFLAGAFFNKMRYKGELDEEGDDPHSPSDGDGLIGQPMDSKPVVPPDGQHPLKRPRNSRLV
jgi:hypothetical protein